MKKRGDCKSLIIGQATAVPGASVKAQWTQKQRLLKSAATFDLTV
jgi:hypothetical protein